MKLKLLEGEYTELQGRLHASIKNSNALRSMMLDKQIEIFQEKTGLQKGMQFTIKGLEGEFTCDGFIKKNTIFKVIASLKDSHSIEFDPQDIECDGFVNE